MVVNPVDPTSGSYRILVYGAGVLGSLYAARFWRAGRSVSILARSQRLADLRKHGIVLEDRVTGERTVVRVPVVDSLSPNDDYDVVLVIVRKNQVDAVLPSLAAAGNVPAICFMTNSADGHDRWSSAVGKPRLLLGFPGAGGTREGEVIRYAVLPAWIQPTTIGELDGRFTLRLERLLEVFRQSGFPVTASADMGSWLVSHVAVVSPLANAIYFAAANNHALASDKDTLRLAVDAIREGFNVVRTMGLRVTPSRLRIIEVFPVAIVVGLLQAWTGTRHFETVAASHALV